MWRALQLTSCTADVALQIKVWLGENMDHYYVLSRFLICRMLTVTKIPYIKVWLAPIFLKKTYFLFFLRTNPCLQAVKIALETKKYLVDNNLKDVTQV